MRKYLVLLICTFISLSIYGQSSKGLDNISSLEGRVALQKIFNALEAETGLSLSYNPLAFEAEREVTIIEGSRWRRVLDILKAQVGLEYQIDKAGQKILIKPSAHLFITGVVKDSASLESLPSVAIFSNNNEGVYTNEEGYFRIKVPRKDSKLFISYLGWKTKEVDLSRYHKQNLEVLLSYDNELPVLTIRDNEWTQLSTIGIRDAKERPVGKILGINGEPDLISQLKTAPEVSVGYEAQNGFLVRGGGPDQNLVLVDGVPLFESTHLGGISSVFSDDIVKSADLYSGAVPSRFGGRLSSVLDIRLKDGNRKEYNRSISLGLERVGALIEGPIGDNTSFIFSGRASILSTYISPILSRYNNLETNLNYSDVYFKVSHWFSNTSRLSVKIFNIHDNIGIDDTSSSGPTRFFDSNRINWDNRLVSLNWSKDLSDKIFINAQLGSSNFYFDSKSVTKTIVDNVITDSLNVRTTSCHDFYSGQVYLDIFTESIGRIKVGGGGIQYSSSPSVLEQDIQEDLVEDFCGDSIYVTTELYAFVEQDIILSEYWSAQAGVRFNAFLGVDTTSLHLQPRVSLTYKEFPHLFSIDYSRMNQFLHLLTNPSSGLPSDLWVPSTTDIAPETSNLFSINYARKSKGKFDFSIAAFYRNYNNIVEYTNPTDIIQVQSQLSLFNFDTENVPWESRVTTGTGESFGLEFNVASSIKDINFNVAYTLSRSTRTLEIDNEIVTFPFKYDRPHNLSLTALRNIGKRSTLQLNFALGDGLRWTIPNQIESTSQGDRIVATERNNARLGRFYHHLDLSFTTQRSIRKENDLNLTFGLYNIYNQRNPFYGQLLEGGAPGVARVNEISLYPIFPQINVKFNW